MSDMVNHPAHYGGAENPYEHVKVAEAWGLDERAHLYNCTKYIARAGRKGDRLQDLEKAQWYLDREVANERARRQVHGSLTSERVTQLVGMGYSVSSSGANMGMYHARLENEQRQVLWSTTLLQRSGEAWEAADRHAGGPESAVQGLEDAGERPQAPAATRVAARSDDVSTVLEAVYTPRSSVTSWRDHAKRYLAPFMRLVGFQPAEIRWGQAPPNVKGATIQIVILGNISPPNE